MKVITKQRTHKPTSRQTAICQKHHIDQFGRKATQGQKKCFIKLHPSTKPSQNKLGFNISITRVRLSFDVLAQSDKLQK